MTHDVALSVLGRALTVRCDDERMTDLVRQLWEPFVARGGKVEDPIVIRTTPGGWRIEAPPDAPSSAVDPWVLAAVLRNLITRRAVAGAASIYPLHGAAAERDGVFLVLAAAPRAGKTTLLLELVSLGWKLVTDDLVPLDPATATATPFPKPLSVRDPARWRTYASGWEVPEWLPPPRAVGLIPATAFRLTDATSYRPSLLAFSRFEPGASAGAEELSPARTAAACGENLHPARDRTPEALRAVARLGSVAPGWSLRYGRTRDALDLLENRLAAL